MEIDVKHFWVGNVTTIELHNLQPGSAISFLFTLPEKQDEACKKLRQIIEDAGMSLPVICGDLTFNDINRILYRCDQEEREDGSGKHQVLKVIS